MNVSGSKTIITGASTGIGASLARLMQGRGARLVLISRKTHTYELAGAHWIAADLSIPAERERALAEALTHLGEVDILVNNAGAGAYVPTMKISDEIWNYLYELNLNAPVHLSRRVLPAMVARRQGMIVNIASIAAQVPLPWFTMYSTTKAALLSFTHGLGMELYGTGVKTMAVCPGYVRTPFQANVVAGKPPAVLQQTRHFAITPERCASDIVEGIERDARTVVTPASGKLLNLAYFLFPRLIDWQFARYNRNLEKAAN